MAAITHLAKTDQTVRTTTSTTGVELANYTISWSDLTGAGFAAGDDVFFLVAVKTFGSANSVNIYFSTGFGTTYAGRSDISDGSSRAESVAVSAPGYQHFWIHRQTLIENENIYFTGYTTSGTASYDNFEFLALNLSDLTSNDFAYTTADHSGTAPSSYDTSGASFALPATGDWLLFSSTFWEINSTSAIAYSAINNGSADISEIGNEGEDVDDLYVMGNLGFGALASGTTVRARYKASASHVCTKTKLFALRLDAFSEAWGHQGASSIDLPFANLYYDYVTNASYSHPATGPLLALGFSPTGGGGARQGVINVGGSEWPAANANGTTARDNGASTVIASLLFSYAASEASGTKSFAFQIRSNVAGADCVSQTAAIISLELAPAGVTLIPIAGVGNWVGAEPAKALRLGTVAGAGSFAGNGPGVAWGLEPGPGTGVWAGNAPGLTVGAGGIELEPARGLLSGVGASPVLGATLTPSPVSASFLGNETKLSLTLAGITGQILAQGESPTLTQQLTPQLGQGTFPGQTPTRSKTLAPSPGTITTSGETPALSGALSPSQGQATFPSQAPTASLALSPEQGTGHWGGEAPALVTVSILTPTPGLISATGDAPRLAGDLTLTPARGALSFAGTSPDTSLTLAPFPQVVSAVGGIPSQILSLSPSSGAGAFQASAPPFSLTLSVSSGAVFVEGASPELAVVRDLLPLSGQATFSGAEADLPLSVSPLPGSATLQGRTVSLTLTSPEGLIGTVLNNLFARLRLLQPDGVLVLRNPTVAFAIPAAGTVVMSEQEIRRERGIGVEELEIRVSLDLLLPRPSATSLSALEASVRTVLSADRTLAGRVETMFLRPALSTFDSPHSQRRSFSLSLALPEVPG